MSHHYWLKQVKEAMQLELQEIGLMAQLAQQLPTAAMRMQVIGKIAEEAVEANTWNSIYASFEGMYGPGFYNQETATQK
ncbi:hypothetical protein [Desulfoscipio geothermicus]|uniref:Uncharacterized protein n=1 Tax=Desulfoscipio geothermicus DSM 3669 TaxID=1121426 RepID=A0A1I6DRG0_9FIRM|nr:hypothetical protein [Desulfoscipio geothermicus]SFR07948.1 hypothetical protein SAMN05660706_11587 [Desulfoscipio geothermicus DSM 3669]